MQVANAVGAALSQVSGSFDRVVTDTQRSEAVKEAKAEAVEAAVKAGAVRETVKIIEVNEVALAYLPGEGDLCLRFVNIFLLHLNVQLCSLDLLPGQRKYQYKIQTPPQ